MEEFKLIEQDALAVIPENVMDIQSQDDYTKAGDLLKIVKNKVKSLDEKRKEYTQPIEQTKKKLISDFKRIAEPLIEFGAELSNKMVEFNEIEQKRLDEEQKKIDDDALEKLKEDKESAVDVPVVNDIRTTRGNIATSTITKSWDFEILDPLKVPNEYCSPDSVKLRQAVKSGQREIDGVKIFEKKSITSR